MIFGRSEVDKIIPEKTGVKSEMAARIVPLRTLVRSVGNRHEEFNEILRRIFNEVMLSGEETIVISQIVGTFYKQRRRETRRVFQGVEYILPARDVLQLRPPPRDGIPVEEEMEMPEDEFPSASNPEPDPTEDAEVDNQPPETPPADGDPDDGLIFRGEDDPINFDDLDL